MTMNNDDVVAQFVRDGLISNDRKQPMYVDLNTAQEEIKTLLDKIRKLPEPGDLIICGSVGCNGGSIELLQLTKLESRSELYGRRNHIVANSLNSILIEPIDYPHIEPYDRQPPYYIGLSYHDLIKHVTDRLSIYTQITPSSVERNVHTSFDEFYYNNFWKTLTFGLAIERADISQFISNLFEKLGYDQKVCDIATDWISTNLMK